MTVGRIFIAGGIVLAILALAGIGLGIGPVKIAELAIISVGIGALAG